MDVNVDLRVVRSTPFNGPRPSRLHTLECKRVDRWSVIARVFGPSLKFPQRKCTSFFAVYTHLHPSGETQTKADNDASSVADCKILVLDT